MTLSTPEQPVMYKLNRTERKLSDTPVLWYYYVFTIARIVIITLIEEQVLGTSCPLSQTKRKYDCIYRCQRS